MPTVPRASNAAAAADSGMLVRVDRRPTRRTPRRAWRDRRPARRTHPSPRWHGREPPAPARCAAAARGSGRPASGLPRRRCASAVATAPPFRISRPSAASPIVPVTTTRSPGLAPLRRTILPGGTRPNAVTEIISGPGVETVSPPSSGQPNRLGVLAERARERRQPGIVGVAQRQRQHEARGRRALGGEIGQVHPQRLARDGVGRIVGQKMHAFDDGVGGHDDVVAARPAGSPHHRSGRTRRDRSRAAGNSARSGSLRRTAFLAHSVHRPVIPGATPTSLEAITARCISIDTRRPRASASLRHLS